MSIKASEPSRPLTDLRYPAEAQRFQRLTRGPPGGGVPARHTVVHLLGLLDLHLVKLHAIRRATRQRLIELLRQPVILPPDRSEERRVGKECRVREPPHLQVNTACTGSRAALQIAA